jgi:4a-hydroxytetrahydrobiopterin dehydratase
LINKLEIAAREAAMGELKGWSYDGTQESIGKSFKFADFAAAFGFMAQVALRAEKAGHHPDWSNSYNRVTIALSTHDAGGVTERDIALAKAIDAISA